ncbi:MAG: hypothetical protein ACREK8_06855 [Gemmatimonadales bacterium]
MPISSRQLTILALALVAGCSSDPGNDTGGPSDNLATCSASGSTPIALAVGEFRTIDASQQGDCIFLPGGATAQEYVVVGYSGFGISTSGGSEASYALQSVAGIPAPAAQFGGGSLGTAALPGSVPSTAAQFELNLRRVERELAANPLIRPSLRQPPAAAPAVGDKDSFNVCATAACSSFVRVGATVKYAGNPGVIYLDDHVADGAETIEPSDIQQLGALFDDYLYPTDTTAFGRESDINNDQHIAILLTPAVNNLTTDCSNGRIIGFTFSNDLLPGAAGSNRREMFYTITTSAPTAKCKGVSRASALAALPPTLIHEMQHMISFNQHVLLRFGRDQDVWLNEGLSHFAEELGWRTVPSSQCTDCFSVFAGGDVGNAYSYLANTDGQFLIAPEATDGTLAERGAAWLFVRWLADHFSTDTLLGTEFTRSLEASGTVGATRIEQVTGVDFPTLVGEWQLANWTDNLPGFPQGGLLDYRTWNFRQVFADNFQVLFPKLFPLTPDSTGGAYSHTGVLPAGSGRMVRFQLAAGSPGATVRLAASLGGATLTSTIVPWLAVVRTQ